MYHNLQVLISTHSSYSTVLHRLDVEGSTWNKRYNTTRFSTRRRDFCDLMCTRYTLSARAQYIINLTTNSVHAQVPGSYTVLPRTDATEVAWSLIMMCDGWMDQPAIQRPIHRNLCTIHSNFSARFTADQIAHQQRCCFHHEVSPPCRGIPHYSRRYPRRDLHFGRDQYFHGRGRSFCFGTGCVFILCWWSRRLVLENFICHRTLTESLRISL